VVAPILAIGAEPRDAWPHARLDRRGRPLKDGVIADFEIAESIAAPLY